MLSQFNVYSFSNDNKFSLIFLPGYTGGLLSSLIDSLISFYVREGNCDVLGLELDYKDDMQDLYQSSQEILKNVVTELQSKYVYKKIIIVGKSLGGSLALYNLNALNVSGLVILGFPIVLGWPSQISLLSNNNLETPNYKKQWMKTLEQINIPVQIINGDTDELVDNEFLQTAANKNAYISLSILKNANHGLINFDTSNPCTSECVKQINKILPK